MSAEAVQERLKIALDDFQDAMFEGAGFCRCCSAYAECVEPDARNYRCYECGALEVFGAEELLLMGAISLE